MDRVALDQAYNNRNAVADYPAIAAERKARSDHVRAARRFHADLRYGDSPRERLDFFPADGAAAPVLVFFHGGYWQSNDKEASSFLVEGPLARGFSVALVEYTLAPEATIDRIVGEAKRAIEWLARTVGSLGGRADALVVAGHSAGGHLAAMLIDHPAVAATLPISGLFDLEPIRLNYLNDKLRLTAESARHHSPLLHLPAACRPARVAVGAGELPELVRQSADYAEALRARGLPAKYLPLASHDHFSILEELASAEGRLCEALADLLAEALAR
jgi:acetyl esterase/lipase